MTIPRLESSALREWDRLAGAATTARPEPRRLGPWTVEVVRLAAKIVLVALLPFIALVKVAVSSISTKGGRSRSRLRVGVACTTAVVTASERGRGTASRVASASRSSPAASRSRSWSHTAVTP